MENNLLAHRIANAIMMDNSFKGHYLIVEGNKDYKLFSKFIDDKNVKIKEAFGFEKVKLALQILSDRGYTNKLGIIDCDFSEILNIEHNVDGLFITDMHDIEVMIIKTQSLETVLRTFVSTAKIKAFENKKGKSIRESIFEIGQEIGYLKLANKIHDLGIIFKPQTADGNQIKYKDFIDDKEFNFNGRKSMINSLLNYSRSKSKNLKLELEITQRLDEIASKTYDINHVVNGHDLSNIILLLIKKVFSSTSKMLNDFNAIEDSLTLAYEYEDFKKTELYKGIANFEIANTTTIWR